MAKKQKTTVKSRVNGLTIGIPSDAKGVVRRFTSKGDNELVFHIARTSSFRRAVEEDPVLLDLDGQDDEAPAKAEKPKTKGRRKKAEKDPVVD